MHLLSISHLYFYTCNACIEYMPVLYVFYICITIVEITLKAPHMCHFDICNKHAAHMPMWNPCVQSHSYYYVRSIYIYIYIYTWENSDHDTIYIYMWEPCESYDHDTTHIYMWEPIESQDGGTTHKLVNDWERVVEANWAPITLSAVVPVTEELVVQTGSRYDDRNHKLRRNCTSSDRTKHNILCVSWKWTFPVTC